MQTWNPSLMYDVMLLISVYYQKEKTLIGNVDEIDKALLAPSYRNSVFNSLFIEHFSK